MRCERSVRTAPTRAVRKGTPGRRSLSGSAWRRWPRAGSGRPRCRPTSGRRPRACPASRPRRASTAQSGRAAALPRRSSWCAAPSWCGGPDGRACRRGRPGTGCRSPRRSWTSCARSRPGAERSGRVHLRCAGPHAVDGPGKDDPRTALRLSVTAEQLSAVRAGPDRLHARGTAWRATASAGGPRRPGRGAAAAVRVHGRGATASRVDGPRRLGPWAGPDADLPARAGLIARPAFEDRAEGRSGGAAPRTASGRQPAPPAHAHTRNRSCRVRTSWRTCSVQHQAAAPPRLPPSASVRRESSSSPCIFCSSAGSRCARGRALGEPGQSPAPRRDQGGSGARDRRGGPPDRCGAAAARTARGAAAAGRRAAAGVAVGVAGAYGRRGRADLARHRAAADRGARPGRRRRLAAPEHRWGSRSRISP